MWIIRLIPLLAVALARSGISQYEAGYISDWNAPVSSDWTQTGGLHPAKCIDIPANLTLCHGIGYSQMRLPNLLEHDTLREVTQQAVSWVPLLGIQCHQDTQLFLCSLFSPVCLERAIWPCRSLCQAVKTGCEIRMNKYGFPWPEMLRCDKFPADNDLCIGVRTLEQTDDNICPPCKQPNTFEAIVDNYCEADLVTKIKVTENVIVDSFARIKTAKRKRLLKSPSGASRREFRDLAIYMANGEKCDCPIIAENEPEKYYMAMAKRIDNKMIVTSLQSWDRKNKEQKKALRSLKKKADVCKHGLEVLATDVGKKGKKRKQKNNKNNDNNENRRGRKGKRRNKNKRSKSKRKQKDSVTTP